MKLTLKTIAIVAAIVAAGPAYAQLVNGTSGSDTAGAGPAPVGTKAGGSPASMSAPGEAVAIESAAANDAAWKAGGALPTQTAANRPTRDRTADNMPSPDD